MRRPSIRHFQPTIPQGMAANQGAIAVAHRMRLEAPNATLAYAFAMDKVRAIWNCLKEKNHTCKARASMAVYARAACAPGAVAAECAVPA